MTESYDPKELARLKAILFPKSKPIVDNSSHQLTPTDSIKASCLQSHTSLEDAKQEKVTVPLQAKQIYYRVRDTIEDFAQDLSSTHFCTTPPTVPHNLTMSYFVSVYSQIYKARLSHGFKLVSENALLKVQQQKIHEIKIFNLRRDNMARSRRRLLIMLHRWRFNTLCQTKRCSLKLYAQAVLGHESTALEFIKQVCQQHCDLLVYDNHSQILTALLETNSGSSNVKTVTNRDKAGLKKYKFTLVKSATKEAIMSQQEVVIVPLTTYPDFHSIDRPCSQQLETPNSIVTPYKSALFRKLFDRNGNVIGMLRQYSMGTFLQIKPIPPKELCFATAIVSAYKLSSHDQSYRASILQIIDLRLDSKLNQLVTRFQNAQIEQQVLQYLNEFLRNMISKPLITIIQVTQNKQPIIKLTSSNELYSCFPEFRSLTSTLKDRKALCVCNAIYCSVDDLFFLVRSQDDTVDHLREGAVKFIQTAFSHASQCIKQVEIKIALVNKHKQQQLQSKQAMKELLFSNQLAQHSQRFYSMSPDRIIPEMSSLLNDLLLCSNRSTNGSPFTFYGDFFIPPKISAWVKPLPEKPHDGIIVLGDGLFVQICDTLIHDQLNSITYRWMQELLNHLVLLSETKMPSLPMSKLITYLKSKFDCTLQSLEWQNQSQWKNIKAKASQMPLPSPILSVCGISHCPADKNWVLSLCEGSKQIGSIAILIPSFVNPRYTDQFMQEIILSTQRFLATPPLPTGIPRNALPLIIFIQKKMLKILTSSLKLLVVFSFSKKEKLNRILQCLANISQRNSSQSLCQAWRRLCFKQPSILPKRVQPARKLKNMLVALFEARQGIFLQRLNKQNTRRAAINLLKSTLKKHEKVLSLQLFSKLQKFTKKLIFNPNFIENINQRIIQQAWHRIVKQVSLLQKHSSYKVYIKSSEGFLWEMNRGTLSYCENLKQLEQQGCQTVEFGDQTVAIIGRIRLPQQSIESIAKKSQKAYLAQRSIRLATLTRLSLLQAKYFRFLQCYTLKLWRKNVQQETIAEVKELESAVFKTQTKLNHQQLRLKIQQQKQQRVEQQQFRLREELESHLSYCDLYKVETEALQKQIHLLEHQEEQQETKWANKVLQMGLIRWRTVVCSLKKQQALQKVRINNLANQLKVIIYSTLKEAFSKISVESIFKKISCCYFNQVDIADDSFELVPKTKRENWGKEQHGHHRLITFQDEIFDASIKQGISPFVAPFDAYSDQQISNEPLSESSTAINVFIEKFSRKPKRQQEQKYQKLSLKDGEGCYKLSEKTLKFLKRMGKIQ